METSSNRELARASHELQQRPYDPRGWLSRARICFALNFPELAAGDAYKAVLLCTSHQRTIRPGWGRGYGLGFLMSVVDLDENTRSCLVAASGDLEGMGKEARMMLNRMPTYRSSVYPWTKQVDRVRSDSLLEDINQQFQQAGDQDPYLEVRRFAFNNDPESLGVYAKRDIKQGELVLEEECAIWVRGYLFTHHSHLLISRNPQAGIDMNGLRKRTHRRILTPGLNGTQNPSTPQVNKNLQFILNHVPLADAADVVMRCHALLLTLLDPITTHPLRHPLIARLTPAPSASPPSTLSYLEDLVIPIQALQQHGVDVFANPAYDTWVILTVHARLGNNAWSTGGGAGVAALYSLFNHSCEPNLRWASRPDRPAVVEVTARRDIEAGEQLFMEYDQYLADKSVAERRRGLWRWLGMECQCVRCLEEEVEAMKQEEMRMSGRGGCDGSVSTEWMPDLAGELDL